jgi:hypothetical protein
MSSGLRRIIAIAAILGVVLTSAAEAQSHRRSKKQQQESAPAPAPVDKRDRLVNAPGSVFNGKAYWQATAQCGGIYFKLGSIYSEAAIRAKVIKPDPVAYTSFNKDANTANRTATGFFESAERFLIADRKLTRDEAVMSYDPVSNASGDRIKTAEAAAATAKSCPELYATCHGAFPQVCRERDLAGN